MNYICGIIYYGMECRLVEGEDYKQVERKNGQWIGLTPRFTNISSAGVLSIAISHIYLMKNFELPMVDMQ